MYLSHSARPGHTVEAELLAFGIALLFLAVMLRPSRSGRRQEFIVALLAGVLLIGAAFITPRL